jgi:hypothetical protein
VTLNNRGRGRLARIGPLRLVAGVASIMIAATTAAWAVGTASAAETPTSSPVVQIDAGGAGEAPFIADTYFVGGLDDMRRDKPAGAPNFSRTVAHPISQTVWDTNRFLESTYTVPNLPPGATYEVRLYFIEYYWSKVGQRVFDVDINGTLVLQDFDIMKTAVIAGGDGPHIGVERDFTTTVDASGKVTIKFIRGKVDQPLINAIVLQPAA